MGYLDKMHKKIEIDKMLQKVMQDPRFKAHIKKSEEEAMSRAFDAFLLISVDYLYRNFGCKKAGILKYIDFVVRQMHFTEEDPDYFVLLNEELASEVGVNILENRLEARNEKKKLQKNE